MNTALAIAGSVFVGLAALIHLYIWTLESLRWSQPSTWRTFGVTSQEDAETVKPMAFNQGFYNLFLTIGVAIGLVLAWTGAIEAGLALVFLAAGSMVGAALVLILSSPKLARAAAIQGAAPLVGIILLVLALTTA
jgi:putative membrane protein